MGYSRFTPIWSLIKLPPCSGYERRATRLLHPASTILLAYTKKNHKAFLVRKGGLEPPRPKALPPQGSVSTNSTTTAAVSHSSSISIKMKGKYSITQQFLVQLSKFQAFFVQPVHSY